MVIRDGLGPDFGVYGAQQQSINKSRLIVTLTKAF